MRKGKKKKNHWNMYPRNPVRKLTQGALMNCSNAVEKQRQGYKNVPGIGNIDKNVPEGVMAAGEGRRGKGPRSK